MRIHRDELGQTIILVALSLPIILGFIGFATDVGLLFMDKRQIQTAADAAAIAGALNLKYGSTVYVAAGQDASAANGYTDTSQGGTATVAVHEQPTWPSSNYVGQKGYVEATVTKPESTIFLAIFGHSTVTVTARAVATNQAKGNGCLYTVETSGTGFTDNGGGKNALTAPNCGLVVDSDMRLNGNTKLDFGSIGVVGTYTKKGASGSVNPTPIAGIPPESDPLNYLPQFSFAGGTVSCATGYDCTNSPVSVPTTCATTAAGVYKVAAGATLSPGCYVGLTFPSSGTVTLKPGLYIVDGNLSFGNGNINGSGVTFYWGDGGSIGFGSGTYNLTPPNDPTQLFNGVIFAESISDTSSFKVSGNASSVVDGVIYAPGTSFTFNGNPSITLNADFVVHDITLDGNVSLTSFAALSGFSDPLTAIALVE